MLTLTLKKKIPTLFFTFFISILLILTGCASNEVIDNEAESIEIEVSETDPYEGFNRKVFAFNDGLDEYIAEPISDAYLWITPQFVQTGIANFFNNLKDINVVLNDVMQGKLAQGAEDTGRFAVNSTIGLLGLFDVATEFGLQKHDEDFAQTLAVWGVPQGPYLVLPVLGPSTSRGIPGSIFDTASNPASYVGFPIQMVQMLNARANAEGALNFIDEAALDPYVFTRESFLQFRKHLITDGESETSDDTLDFDDAFYDDEELSDDLLESNIEVNQDISKASSAEIDKNEITKSYKLELQPTKPEDFDKASESFDGAVQSFDATSNSFIKANDKIKQLDNP